MIDRVSRGSRALLAVVAFGFIAAACGGGSTGSGDSGFASSPGDPVAEQAAGDEAPGVSSLFAGEFVDLDGETVELASFEGQDVIMWFWAPW